MSAISCDNESGFLVSNQHNSEYWEALDRLVHLLGSRSPNLNMEILASWKDSHRLASARDPYAWMAVIEEIKNSDLVEVCRTARVPEELRLVMSDKPAMLKIAGEVTNGLLHSYNTRHRLTFVQCASKVPS